MITTAMMINFNDNQMMKDIRKEEKMIAHQQLDYRFDKEDYEEEMYQLTRNSNAAQNSNIESY